MFLIFRIRVNRDFRRIPTVGRGRFQLFRLSFAFERRGRVVVIGAAFRLFRMDGRVVHLDRDVEAVGGGRVAVGGGAAAVG